ncbi:MAG: ABC transporter substrate-binding protein, partial [Planctomycetota bacterium]
RLAACAVGLAAMGCASKTPAPIDQADQANKETPVAASASGSAASSHRGIPKDTWPASWFEVPKTASELGITNFSESPALADAVARGELPPVKERLPEDPIVVEPLEGTGRHGGTAIVFSTSNTGWGEGGILNNIEPPLRICPEVRRTIPNLARDWEYSEDGRTFTLFLRKGIRWSDGHPHTADDYLFWFEHMQMNKDLTPIRSAPWNTARVEKLDRYTVRYSFEKPHPFFVKELAHHGNYWSRPGHYLKKYHADFVPKDELEEKARELGFQDWVGYFGKMQSTTDPEVNCPTLQAFVVESQGLNILTGVRNPYYPKVDTEGRQLPYIDRIMALVVQDQEMMTAKACTGQATIAGVQTKLDDIPLFKRGEKKCGYETYIWNRLHGVDVAIQPNQTCEDPGLREVFRDVRFRRALSVAINRDEINQTVYFGRGTPRQTCVIPSSSFYEENFATAYAHHDPAEARRLLDEMGVVDRDGDGRRDRADGGPLNITLEWTPMETPKGPTMELVIEHWREVGLDISLRQISGPLQNERARGNLMHMTLWHADRSTDILFPPEPFWFVPMRRHWEVSIWPMWALWFLTDGEKGEEPTEEAMKLVRWWREMRTCMDAERRLELGKNILRSHAENLWTIGTVGLAPHPIIVSDRLKNVPRRGYWGWDCRWSFPYHPESWWLDESED